MKELPPADVLRLDLTQQFFDAVTTGYFVTTVLFCFLIVLAIVAGCWEATRKSRRQASALEPLRREETSPATAAPLCVYDRGPDSILAVAFPKSDAGLSRNRK